jgi:hypothetical protein
VRRGTADEGGAHVEEGFVGPSRGSWWMTRRRLRCSQANARSRIQQCRQSLALDSMPWRASCRVLRSGARRQNARRRPRPGPSRLRWAEHTRPRRPPSACIGELMEWADTVRLRLLAGFRGQGPSGCKNRDVQAVALDHPRLYEQSVVTNTRRLGRMLGPARHDRSEVSPYYGMRPASSRTGGS